MRKFVPAAAAFLAALLIAGCQTTDSGARQGIDVTSFHLGQPIARGEIRVEPAHPELAGSLQFAQLAPAVERELSRLGWSVSRANARSELVALVRVTQRVRAASRPRSGLSIGLGGGTGGWGRSGVGVGVGATFPVGGARPGEIVVTELGVRIQRRSDATVAWEGRADLEAPAGSPLASPVAAVDRLAEALFRDFPGESGRTMRVR